MAKKMIEEIATYTIKTQMSCHQLPDRYIVQKQPPVVFFSPATLLKRDSSTVVFPWALQNEHLIRKTAASDSSYILRKKLNKIIQEPDWSYLITLFYLLSFIFIRFITRCYS